MNNGTTAIIVIVLVAIVATGCMAFNSLRRVDPGYAGVLIDFASGTTSGQPSVQSFPTGRYILIMPWEFKKLVSFPIAQQTLTMVRRASEGQVAGDDSVECQDRNGVRLNVDSSVLWRVDPGHVADLYLLRPDVPLNDEGSSNDISSLVVRREVRNAITNACSEFTYDEIYGVRRQDFGSKVSELLDPALSSTYILMDKFLLGEVYLQQEQQDAINAVATAQLKAKEAAYYAERAQNQAKANIAEAEGEKQVAILKAEGEAQAIATINAQLSRSPYYMQYFAISKWSGTYPQMLYLGGGDSIPTVFAAPLGVGTTMLTDTLPYSSTNEATGTNP